LFAEYVIKFIIEIVEHWRNIRCKVIHLSLIIPDFSSNFIHYFDKVELGNELRTYIRHVKNQGEALMLDDFSERMAILKVKPRKTLHGGSEKILDLFKENVK